MTVVKFQLSGETACFRKPDVNTYVYFTYGQIHKVALIGMFGAILGYGGYAECKIDKKSKEIPIPEFYEKLSQLKVSVVPCVENGVFAKKIQKFNNTVGYASKEKGGNLIVTEQWLEYPKWDIYVLADTDQGKCVLHALTEQKCVYMPYLGKNDHFATISDVEVYENVKEIQAPSHIDSLFMKKTGKLNMNLADEDDDEEEDEVTYFKYEEKLPIGLHPQSSQYQLESFLFSNMEVKEFTGEAYEIANKVIAFY